MASCFTIIVMLCCLGAAGGYPRGTAYVTGMAELKCNFENIKNQSRASLAFYWQRDQEVVFVEIEGKQEEETVNETFRNNRRVLLENGDLNLYNISLKHIGNYQCRAFESSKGRPQVVINTVSFQLDVLANYSVPEISADSSVDNLENGTSVSFKCTSGHGFPKPKNIIWMLSYRNRTHNITQPCEAENVSETFNVSNRLLLKVEEDLNITCLLKAHNNFVSEVLNIVVKKEIPSVIPEQNFFIITISVVFLVSILILSIVLMWKNRKQCRSRSARSNSGIVQRDAERGPANSQELNDLMPPANEVATG